MDKTTRILVQTIGTGGPNNPVWEALAFVIQEVQPDVLVQVCSEKTHEETLPKYREALAQAGAQPCPDSRIVVLQDEEDVARCIRQITGLLDELRNEFAASEIRVDYTSGTKAMSAAAVAAAVGRRIARLCYATGPRDDTGRATKTTKVVTVGADQAYADLELNELGRLFNLRQFEAVVLQAFSLLPRLTEPLIKARASSLLFLADVYHHWELFDYGKAAHRVANYHELDKCNQYWPRLPVAGLEPSACADTGWDLQQLEKQTQALGELRDGTGGVLRLIDLWANAQRRILEERFDDALARLYRLTEYIGQMRFCKLVGKGYDEKTPTHDIPQKTIMTLAPNYLRSRQHRQSRISPGVKELMQILDEAKDQVGITMRKMCKIPKQRNAHSLGTLLELRNTSLLAHGTSPVGQKTAEAMLNLIKTPLEMHATDLECNFTELCSGVTLLKCPWVT